MPAAASWNPERWSPSSSRQIATLAHALAVTGDERASELVERLRSADAAPLIIGALKRYRDAGFSDLAERARIDLAAFDAAEARVTSSSVPSARASPRP